LSVMLVVDAAPNVAVAVPSFAGNPGVQLVASENVPLVAPVQVWACTQGVAHARASQQSEVNCAQPSWRTVKIEGFDKLCPAKDRPKQRARGLHRLAGA